MKSRSCALWAGVSVRRVAKQEETLKEGTQAQEDRGSIGIHIYIYSYIYIFYLYL